MHTFGQLYRVLLCKVVEKYMLAYGIYDFIFVVFYYAIYVFYLPRDYQAV